MACCKVCCGCKECEEGEEGKCCCGLECCAPSTYCCNAECVSACSEGQEGDCKCGDVCCYQDEYCCEGECVPVCEEGDGGCLCDGSCCPDGSYCCDGVCQEEPCEGCDPCEDCDVVAAAEQSDGDCGFGIPKWSKTQLVLEVGGNHFAVEGSWADGYPEALAGCRMFLVQDDNRTEGSCTCDIFLNNNFVENECASSGWSEVRRRLMVLRCPDGDEAYLEDVTDNAIVTGSERAEPVEPGTEDAPMMWAGYTFKDTDCLFEQPGPPPRLICEGGEPDWYGTPTDWLPDPTVECDP